MKLRHRWLPSLVAAVCLLQLPAMASAGQDATTIYADQLFQQGVRFMKSDECPQAIPKFLRSEQLDPSAATLVNLATCYARVGRTASAWRTYQQASAAAALEKNEDLKGRAEKGIAILVPTLTKLTIITPRGSGSMSFILNGEPLRTDDGLPIPLDPGESVLEAVAPGRAAWRHNLQATEPGATIVLEIPDLLPVPAVEAPPDWRMAGVIVGGAGVASIVVGSILGVSAKATYDQASSDCQDRYCNATGRDLRDNASSKARAANYMIAFGAVLAAGGVVLWFASPGRPKHSAGVGLVPYAPDAPLGLSLEGQL